MTTDKERKLLRLLKLLKAKHKELWGAPLGKRLCSLGCQKIKLEEEFQGGHKRCLTCIAKRQRSYYLKRQAAKIAARGNVKHIKLGRPSKSSSTNNKSSTPDRVYDLK
jgi:hypothetical protein